MIEFGDGMPVNVHLVVTPLTFHRVRGHQGGAEGTEAVERFTQQPLLPVAPHLPVARADVVGHGEASHVGERVLLLGKEGEEAESEALLKDG